MKKIIFYASLLLTLVACKPHTKTPENFIEFMEGIKALGNGVSYSINSDSIGYSEYYSTHFFNSPEDVDGNEKKAINDYIQENVKVLMEKYTPTAVKAYQYDTHIDGKDTTQYIIALKQIEDSIPEWAEQEGFTETFRLYPEFFHYDRQRDKNDDTWTFMTYHNEVKVANKQETTIEETEQLVLDFIAKQKNVKQKPRRYTIDEGFVMGKDDYHAVAFSRGMLRTDSMCINATHYIIPVQGAERQKLADDLWDLFSNHTKNHYSKVHGHWGFECVKYNEISEDPHQMSAQLLQMSIAKDEEGKMLHFQVGYDDRGLHILDMHIETYRFYIPGNWLYIDTIHNKDIVDDMDFGKSEKLK